MLAEVITSPLKSKSTRKHSLTGAAMRPSISISDDSLTMKLSIMTTYGLLFHQQKNAIFRGCGSRLLFLLDIDLIFH